MRLEVCRNDSVKCIWEIPDIINALPALTKYCYILKIYPSILVEVTGVLNGTLYYAGNTNTVIRGTSRYIAVKRNIIVINVNINGRAFADFLSADVNAVE